MISESCYRYNGMTADEIAASLRESISKALLMRYGPAPDAAIVKRVRDEWAAMENCRDILDVAVVYELTTWLKEQREPYWMNGTAGSSFILYLLGVTLGNPLPPHYYCPQCHQVIWQTDHVDGFDLPPDRFCQNDYTFLCGDGHNIPWQTHWGYGKKPYYDILVTESLTEEMWTFLQSHSLSELRAGEKPEARGDGANPCSIRFSRCNITCILDPNKISPYFYDIMRPDASSTYNAVTMMSAVDHEAKKTARLQSNPMHPFADLVGRFGLTHSTGVWDEEACFMVEMFGYSISDLIAHREDIFFYLLSHGFSEEDAWYGMDCVRRGKGLPIVTDEMALARDKWVVDRCDKIAYLFPKAHALEYIFYCLRAKGLSSQFTTSYESLLGRLGHRSKVVMLGGRSGVGKSTFAAYLTKRLTRISGVSVAIFVQNQHDKAMYAKWGNIKSSFPEESVEADSRGTVMLYEESNVPIDIIRNCLAAVPADFVILDLPESMGNYVDGKGLEEKIALMSGIRALADEKNIPILVTSEINRGPEQRKNHRPKITDIQQSAEIIPYTDLVMLLYREGYYDYDANQSDAVCIVADQVGGVLEEIPLLWHVAEGSAEFNDVYYPEYTIYREHL